MSLAVLADRAPFVRTVRCRTVAKTLSIGFDVRRWSQCSAGKSKKASSASRSFVRQATAVLGAVFVGEHVDRGLGRRTGRRAANLTKVGFHIDLNREGDLVQHVGGLVNPTALVPSALEDLFDRLPEAEHTVADREVRRNLEHTLLDVERSSRQLCALSRTPVWKPTSSSEETLPGTSFRVKRSAARWGNNSSD
jgi:hypothetical protein